MKKLAFTKCTNSNIEDELYILNDKSKTIGLTEEEIKYREELLEELIKRNEIKSSKTIASHKTWTIEVTTYNDGTCKMIRLNDGFNINELMGLTSFLQQELIAQWGGTIKPDIVERKVVNPNDEKESL